MFFGLIGKKENNNSKELSTEVKETIELDIEDEELKINLSIKKGHHLSPQEYSPYKKGTFDKLTVCNVCGMIGYYCDSPEYSPCQRCGGDVGNTNPKTYEQYIGIWDNEKSKWLTREEAFLGSN